LAALDPQVDVITADASSLRQVLAQRDIGQVAVVVSGLPWAAFDEKYHGDVLSNVVAVMPGSSPPSPTSTPGGLRRPSG